MWGWRCRLGSLLDRVSAIDPLTFPLLRAAALAAGYPTARRAA